MATTRIDYVIDDMRPGDWEGVRAIYLEGIASGNATFETDAPPWEKWNASHLKHCRLIARAGERVLGWAALSPVSDRCAYGGVAEVSVYVGSAARGIGVGRGLLEALVQASEQAGIWTLQAGIFPENGASLAIHDRCGFRRIGTRERLGRVGGTWRNVTLLERRSATVGRD